MRASGERRGGLERLIDTLALLGGGVLLAAAALVCFSVAGRAFFDAPIDGDYEFVKLALGFSGFAVLPLAEARGGHVAADTLVERLPGHWQRRIEAFWHAMQALVLAGLASAMVAGALAMRASGETTMQRQIPLWPGIALAALLLGVSVAAAVRRARRLARGTDAP